VSDPIFERVRAIVVDKLHVSADEVTAEADFMADLGADSLDLVELVMALEEEFEITVPDEDQEQIRTVADAVNYIKQKTGKAER